MSVLKRVKAHSYAQRDHLIASFGVFLSLLGVMMISHYSLGLQGTAMLVASLGASAVVIFTMPHSPLAQPWSVAGGQGLSALVGVACAQTITIPELSMAVAVSASLLVMSLARCLHPPGGATALSAVIGDASLQQLGYFYVFTPVLLNVSVLILMAILINYPFHWRRYPLRKPLSKR